MSKIRIESVPLFTILPPAERRIIDEFDSLLQDIKPLSAKQLRELPDHIRQLSHQLTDERSGRRVGYMNESVQLSAYLRYFMWWNLYRFTALFAGFGRQSFSALEDGGVILDIGSGPLTVPAALWLARPELRSKKLTVYCVDYSHAALASGEEIFLSLAAKTAANAAEGFSETPWRIVRVKGTLGVPIKQKAHLITCANMCNELFYGQGLKTAETVRKCVEGFASYAETGAAFLVIEPGIPYAAHFISLLRDSLLRRKMAILSPCPHEKRCPMPGTRGSKWCHFVQDTRDAPQKLLALSALAGLPKTRATLSFVLAREQTRAAQAQLSQEAGKISAQGQNAQTPAAEKTVPVRIVSDPVKLPGGRGRYACSGLGLTLAVGSLSSAASGSFLEIPVGQKEPSFLPKDGKTGAVILGK